MSDFTIAVNALLLEEGGENNRACDLGGETNWGISKARYPHLDIKKLSREDAIVLYQIDYWNRYRIGEINNQSLANYVLSMIVNINCVKVGYCVQRALNQLGNNLEVDGVMGTATFTAINKFPIPDRLLDKIRLQRLQHYVDRVRQNTSQLANLEGWVRRAIA